MWQKVKIGEDSEQTRPRILHLTNQRLCPTWWRNDVRKSRTARRRGRLTTSWEHQISPKTSLKQKLQIIACVDYIMDQILITRRTKCLNLAKCKKCTLTCHACTNLHIAHNTQARHCGILTVTSYSYWGLGDTPTWTGQYNIPLLLNLNSITCRTTA